MKQKLLYLLLLSMCFTGYSQVQIGSDTKNPSFNFPIKVSGANYTYSQSIYLASEINASGAITSIQWYYGDTKALTNSQNVDIYLKTTTKNVFATDTDWVAVTAADKYATAKTINTGSAAGWVTITLDQPFQYNGVDNLVVAVDENMDGSDSAKGFYTTETPGLRSIETWATDNGAQFNPNPLSPPTSPKNSSNFVPNIIFGGLTQSCTTPANISFSNITASTATVSWNDAATHTEGSQYYLSTSKTAPTASTQPTGSATTLKTIAISGLAPITNYYVWVRNNCGNGTNSAWSEMTSFMSGCSTYAAFFENFDGAVNSATSMPYCWSKIIRGNGGDASTAFVKALNSSTFAYSPTNTLQFMNATSTGPYDIIAVSPELTTLGSGTMRLKFYARYNGTGITSGTVQIGTLDNPSSTGLFTPLPGQTINITGAYALYTVDLTGYTGTDRFIGIRFASTASNTQILIDNVLYEVKPSCPDVSNIAITAITESKVTVTWKDGGVESNWDIAIGDPSETDPSTLQFETTSGTSSNTIHSFTTARNLTPGTNYKVWVRSNCASDKKGYYFGGLTFTTVCTSATVLNENFDTAAVPALPACWSKILRGTTLGAGAFIQTYVNAGSYAGYAASAPNTVKIYTDVASGDTNEVILVSPPLSNLGANTNRLRFKVSGLGTPFQLQIGTLDGNISTAKFTPLASQSPITVNGAPATESIVDFSSYAGGTDKFIGFKIITTNGSKTIFLDDVVWELAPTCADVKNIVVTAATTTVADFSWDPQSIVHYWDVVVGTGSTPNGLTPVKTDLDNNSIEITGLQPGTAYNVWVRSHCDAVNGNWIGPVQFDTACNPATTFSEDFNSYTYSANFLPPCWNNIVRNATADAFVSFTGTTDQNKLITMNANTSNHLADLILVCPIVTKVNDPNYRLNLNATASVYQIKKDTALYTVYTLIEVGTVNNLTPTAVFTKVTEFTPKGATSIDLSSYTGNDQYIALRLKTMDQFQGQPYQFSSQIASIDDVSWTPTALGNKEFDLSKINYYPNPVKDVLNISFDRTISSVAIYNVLGQNVLENSVNDSNAKVNVSMLNPGTYFVKLTAGDQTKTIKIIKD